MYPNEFSGGMRQRVMIAMAMITQPEVLIADEPTTALDVTVQKQILDLIKERKEKQGAGVIFITHDLATVRAIADSIAVMYQGRVQRYGTKSEVLTPPFDDYTDLLLSSVPEMKLGWLEDVISHRKMESAGN